MSDQIITAINPQCNDPQYTALVKKVTETFKLEMLKAMGSLDNPKLFGINAATANTHSVAVHGAVNKYFSSYSPEVRKFIAKKFVTRAAVNGKLGTGLFVSNLSLKGNSPILSQLDIKKDYAFLADRKKLDRFQALKILPLNIGAILSRPGGGASPQTSGGGSAPIVMNGGLKLQLHKVRCAAPTSWEPGNDEINMGGAAADDHGTVTKINEFKVAANFDTNVTQSYAPPRILQSFSLSGSDYPKIFSATLDLAEKDNGGFAEFIEKLYEAVKGHINEIMTILGAAAGAAIGTAIGGSIGAIGGPLGALIGVAAGAIIGALVGWLTSALKDDIFTPQLTSVTIPRAGATFNGSLVSPQALLSYYDHGGAYHVTYSWAVNW